MKKENSSAFEKQRTSGRVLKNAQAVDENDSINAKMMEFEPLLDASVKRNLRSINLTHGDYPFHFLAQTVWHPEKSNLCRIWDSEETGDKVIRLSTEGDRLRALDASTEMD